MPKVFKLPGSALEVNIGQFARQADGAVWLSYGNNVILATVVVAPAKDSEFLGFFPLTVEYRERLSSVGKIPGGFIKREGRLSDAEVLLSRLIDRSIRPLFPKFFLNEVQVIVNLHSYDGEVPLETLGVLATSLAINTSGIPFEGPIGAVICARKGKNAWVVNPDAEFLKSADDQVLAVGTAAAICMVEADCNFISNAELIELLNNIALPEIQKLVAWQKEICADYDEGKRRDYQADEFNKQVCDEWINKIQNALPSNHKDYLFAPTKHELDEKFAFLKKVIQDALALEISDAKLSKAHFDLLLEMFLKKFVPQVVLKENQRFDFRGFSQIRDISCVVDLLPKAHGSAVFTRGQTQALAAVTLGAANDAQKVETLLYGVQDKNFMLHYNFPPFATGEVKPLRSVGRREIGHGYLAEKSFRNVLPEASTFPYTIRSLIDILESNGSSSMATVCATTLALMDAGVPVKKMVSGIAMGLLADEDGNVAILSDISGSEDAYGCMDLKVVGDEQGIVAIQIDVKIEGISAELLAKALTQAQEGRTHILQEMKKCLQAPRAQLKDGAPRCTTIKIASSKIGMVIGPAGKNIKQITADTGTQIDIAEDGTTTIFSTDVASAKKAEGWIRALTGEIRNGSVFQGKVSKVADFGIFVTLVPGKDGLIHVSSVDRRKRDKLATLYKTGDPLDVVVISTDNEGRIKLVAPELEGHDDDLG